MFGKSKKRSIVEEMAMGAAAGVVGTWVIGKVMAKMQQMSKSKEADRSAASQEKQHEKEKDQGTALLAKRMLLMFGAEPTEDRKAKLGQALHWGYGITWGATYGVLRNRYPKLSWGLGLPFGVAFGVFSTEILLTLTGLAPPPPQAPMKRHAGNIAAHVAYAAAADGSYRAIERVMNGRQNRVNRIWQSTKDRLT
ncbi:MAG: DUF1440 domain-containing protein [Persicimonas sp.]